MTIEIRPSHITLRSAFASLCGAFILLSQFGCNSKPTANAAPIDKSEISINDYRGTCQQNRRSSCDNKQIIWRAFFKSYSDGELTLHNVLGDIVLKANPNRSVAPGAIVAFRGRLDDPGKDSSHPIKIKDAKIDFIESDAQTAERLREITNMQTNYCLTLERNDTSHRRAEESGIEFRFSDEHIERDPWAPEKTKIDYKMRMSQPGSPASVTQLLTCEFRQGFLGVSMFTPAQNDIYGHQAIRQSLDDRGEIGFRHDYLTDDDVPDPSAPKQVATSQLSIAATASATKPANAASSSAPEAGDKQVMTNQTETAPVKEVGPSDSSYATAQDSSQLAQAALATDGITIDPKTDERYSLLSHGQIIVDDQGREVANRFIKVVGGVASGSEHHYLVAENCGGVKDEDCEKTLYHFISVNSDGTATVSGPFEPDHKPTVSFGNGSIAVTSSGQTASFASGKPMSIPDEMKAW